MTFPSYPTYKDSGVQWLGEVPQHWPVYSLKRTVDGCVNGLWGDEPDGENDIAVIRVADFERSFSIVGLDKLTYRSVTPKERQSRLIKSGDLLIEKSGGGEKTLVGCVVLFTHEFDAITSNFVARMRPLAEFDSQFLCYAFGSLYHGRVNHPSVKQVTGIQNLDAESYLQERFCFPARADQTQIARFLDHETARIDALIEEQQRLIALLKEKRQAVISHAVTKGLDPTVPMKDSGVEWLGEVPADWYVARTFHLGLDIKTGKVDVNIQEEDGIYPFFTCSKDAKKSNQFSFDCEALLVAGNGEVGYTQYYNGKFEAYQRTYVISNFGEFDERFLRYHFMENLVTSVKGKSIGSVIQFITLGDLRDFPIPVPSRDEQTQIACFLDHETARIDALIEEAMGGVVLLQERRSALISAAVTGKIDVRGWLPPANTQAPESAVAEAH